MASWVLYYADGTTFSSDDGSWGDAPNRGVQAVVIPHEDVGKQILTGEHYVLPPWGSEPQAMDVWGCLDVLIALGYLTEDQRLSDLPASTVHAAGIKFGRAVDNAEYRRLWDWITTDDPKWTRTQRERPRG